MRWIHLCALAALLCSCNHFKEVRLPTFDVAMAVPCAWDDDTLPPVYRNNARPADCPEFVAYVRLHGDFHGGDEQFNARQIRAEAIKRGFEPDALIFQPEGSAYAGSVGMHHGFGIMTSSPVYRPQATAWCVRRTPVRVGVKPNEDDMIITIDEVVRAQSGMLEGDTLLSVDGFAVERSKLDGVSEFDVACFGMQPGQEVKLVWIRPGKGRMEGTCKLLPPKPMSSDPGIAPPPKYERIGWGR